MNILVIDQYSYYVEQFAKSDDGKWWLSEYRNQDDILNLTSIDCEIRLSDIYEEVAIS